MKYRLRKNDLSCRVIDDEVVILDAKGGLYFAGNHSAVAVWDDLVAGAARDDLVRRLVETYDVEPALAAADLDRFLDQLVQRGLVEQVE